MLPSPTCDATLLRRCGANARCVRFSTPEERARTGSWWAEGVGFPGDAPTWTQYTYTRPNQRTTGGPGAGAGAGADRIPRPPGSAGAARWAQGPFGDRAGVDGGRPWVGGGGGGGGVQSPVRVNVMDVPRLWELPVAGYVAIGR